MIGEHLEDLNLNKIKVTIGDNIYEKLITTVSLQYFSNMSIYHEEFLECKLFSQYALESLKSPTLSSNYEDNFRKLENNLEKLNLTFNKFIGLSYYSNLKNCNILLK